MENVTIGGAVLLRASRDTCFEADGGVSLLGARIAGNLNCFGGRMKRQNGDALLASNADIGGDVLLSQTGTQIFEADGRVNLHGARISGDLNCTGGKFRNPGGEALRIAKAQISGEALLSYTGNVPLEAFGSVTLSGAEIGRNLDCTGSRFSNPNGDALSAEHADIGGALLLRTMGGMRFEAEGRVGLLGVRVAGNVECDGARFHNPGKDALQLGNAEIEGAVLLRARSGGTRFEAEGSVAMYGVRIRGSLDCDGGRFHNPGGSSILISNAVIDGAVLMGVGYGQRFESEGEIFLLGARIRSDLSCAGGLFKSPGGRAISADKADIEGAVLLRNSGDFRFESEGIVGLHSVKIGRNLDCGGARFSNPEGDCLVATNAEINGTVLLRGADRFRFQADGTVNLFGSHIIRDLEIGLADLSSLGWSLNVGHAKIDGTLLAFSNTVQGSLNLTGATIGRLYDDPDTGWGGAQAGEAIHLNEVTIKTIGVTDNARRPLWRARARWLKRNTPYAAKSRRPFSSQPWREVASAFEAAGEHGEARRLRRAELQEANRHRGKAGPILSRWMPEGMRTLTPQNRRVLLDPKLRDEEGALDGMPLGSIIVFGILSLVLWPVLKIYAKLKQFSIWAAAETMFGYGQSITRATMSAAIVWVLGAVGIDVMQARGALVAVQDPDREAMACPDVQSALYAIDLMIPILELGEARRCQAGAVPGSPAAEGAKFGPRGLLSEAATWSWAKALYTLFGATVIGFALLTWTGIFRPKRHE